MPLLRCCVVIGSALLLAGCGGSTAPVTGTVKLKDGKAAIGATVVFTDPAKRTSASGKCDAEGKYQLTSQKPRDGAPPGKYIVTIHAPSAADSSKAPPPRTFNAKYENPDKSGLDREVKSGPNVVDFTLDPP